MERFHLTPKGEAKPCKASLKACPLGGTHYSTIEEARSAYESSMSNSILASHEKISVQASLSDFVEELKVKYPDLQITLAQAPGEVVALHSIRFPKELQKTGLGTKVMEELVAKADEEKWKLALTPSTDFGATSKARLERFYRRFGFLPNKGKAKDFSTMEAMVRKPHGS